MGANLELESKYISMRKEVAWLQTSANSMPGMLFGFPYFPRNQAL